MGKKSKAPKQRVVEYFMSLHYGVCQGPVDSLNRVRMNEKQVWRGKLRSESVIQVAKPDAYGGIKKEGGAAGLLYWQTGSYLQKSCGALAAKLGLTPDTMPGYRGIATAFLTGGGSAVDEPTSNSGFLGGVFSNLTAGINNIFRPSSASQIGKAAGFYVSANQPFVPPAWFNVTRLPKGWYPEKAGIPRGNVGSAAIYFLLDRSNSLSTSEFNAIKSAVLSGLDLIEESLADGDRVDVGVLFYSTGFVKIERTEVDSTKLDEIRAFINAATKVTGGDVLGPMQEVENWFLATKDLAFTSRSVILVTDTNTEDNMTAAAAGPAADMLNRNDGVFSHNNNNPVDLYAINFASTTTTWTQLLDNTPEDGIPIITSGDSTSLTETVRNAILSGIEFDANPANMIVECLTDTSWGMGAPFSALDLPRFQAAADTLFDEKFGLSMIWTRQQEIQKFIQEILDHIEANFFVDPTTGKFVLDLIRDDYDPDDLELYDESNCVTNSFQRRSPAEIINEINLTYTDPESEQDVVITAQDLGGFVINDGVPLSDNRNYYGVRSVEKARDLLERDLSVVTAPLASAEIETDRKSWKLVPGKVLKYSSEEHNADRIAMRVVKVNYGKPGDSDVLVSLTQDIFSFARPTLALPPDTLLDTGAKEPSVFEYFRFMTLNYFLAGYLVDVVAASGAEYPDVFVAFLASTANTDAVDLEIVGETTDPAGNTSLELQGTRAVIARGLLASAFPAEAETESAGFASLTRGTGPQIGGFALIGPDNASDVDMELVMFSGQSGGNFVLKRGILDTWPRSWPVGTPIRFFSNSTFIEDDQNRSALSEVEYKLLMRTSLGVLNPADAPSMFYTPSERPYMPTRPANTSVNGVAFGDVDARGVDPVPFLWANRNRLTEEALVLSWDAATVTPESGQTTAIVILDPYTGAEINRVDGLTGTSYNLPASAFMGYSEVDVKIISERDGFESFQGHTQHVLVSTGYGYSYGLNYGGYV